MLKKSKVININDNNKFIFLDVTLEVFKKYQNKICSNKTINVQLKDAYVTNELMKIELCNVCYN